MTTLCRSTCVSLYLFCSPTLRSLLNGHRSFLLPSTQHPAHAQYSIQREQLQKVLCSFAPLCLGRTSLCCARPLGSPYKHGLPSSTDCI
ncbi:hypothetical protein XELAEV_18004018mg [Xenopus laevis]|uniref:Uncharacterized protein n=1 Tax=Xenopus laevis TaxID=8355 RepID=A0A974BSA2_XENLA|nr:hypothetical protein XELAEV_18004018mg [Xenopus laevis]